MIGTLRVNDMFRLKELPCLELWTGLSHLHVDTLDLQQSNESAQIVWMCWTESLLDTYGQDTFLQFLEKNRWALKRG